MQKTNSSTKRDALLAKQVAHYITVYGDAMAMRTLYNDIAKAEWAIETLIAVTNMPDVDINKATNDIASIVTHGLLVVPAHESVKWQDELQCKVSPMRSRPGYMLVEPKTWYVQGVDTDEAGV